MKHAVRLVCTWLLVASAACSDEDHATIALAPPDDGKPRAHSDAGVHYTGPDASREGSGGSHERGGEPADAGSDAGAMPDAGLDDAPSSALPLVMLLVDTSGSMVRAPDCECITPGCNECMPDCEGGQRDRFLTIMEALTGSAERFSCETLQRTAQNGATYDQGYALPFHRPHFGGQRTDGVLDKYRNKARFGLATFDGFDTYTGAAPLVAQQDFDHALSRTVVGLWSYGAAAISGDPKRDIVAGRFFYPGCTKFYFMDTGIRSPEAEEGALRFASDATLMNLMNDQIQAELIELRPYGATPLAAALDDLYFAFASDPDVSGSLLDRARDRNLIVLTDGFPDDDYRSYGCNCSNEPGDPDAGTSACGIATAAELPKMTCPYPTAADAARYLVRGASDNPLDTAKRGPGPKVMDSVYVVTVDSAARGVRLDEIAAAGGTKHARFASSVAGINAALSAILDEILSK